MGETTGQIENYIGNKRDDLGFNLKELEGKVKAVTDWRQQFQRSPLTGVAIAFGGGIVLASMLAGKSSRGSRSATPSDSYAPHKRCTHRRRGDPI
jgi:hypothetical protein